jgi:hypothetical protein
MAKHPDWATKHRVKGTELRFINDKYCLYEVSSKWNSIKKRSQKTNSIYSLAYQLFKAMCCISFMTGILEY